MRNIKWLITKDGLPFTFVAFYIVGVVLFTLPITHDLFILITPYTLVLAAFAVFYYHSEWNTKTVIVDMTDLDAPVLKWNYNGQTPAIDHNGYTKGNDFYLANYRAGLRVLDISNIASTETTSSWFSSSL